MKAGSILIVEDDAASAAYLEQVIRREGLRVRLAGNGVEALLAIETQLPDLVISDLRMPVMDGLELLRHIQQRWPGIPVVILTVAQEISTVVEAVQLGAVNYLVKPASAPALLDAIGKSLRSAGARVAPGERIPEIVGVSRAMVEVRHLVVLAARSDVNVLITGRTGTGKELVARAIHRASHLAAPGPFLAHNCAATPPDLFESEFFGHRRGAFTGADRDHVGLLERAHGGALFLDELESMPPAHQAKLLRVLDDGEVRPVGSAETRRVSVRFFAAMNTEPGEMIADGTLREDLYYRLRGFEIHLPTLKDRPEDVPHLAAHFLEEEADRFTPEALEALQTHPWPGNVRELANAVRAARAIAPGDRIGVHQLSLVAPARSARRPASLLASDTSDRVTLKELEQDAVLQVLRDQGGNRSRAARILGIDRSTLRRKLRECGH